ncbi:MAG: flagellar protein FliS [bacterium]|nr:flagellar protein FliS [bacterium]
MTDEKKKEFTRRLAECNSGEMIVIEFEVLFTYLEDALAIFDTDADEFKRTIHWADAVLVRLQESLDFKYEIAAQLYPLYNYGRRQLALAVATHKTKPVHNTRRVMEPLYQAFQKIAKEDDSPAVMQHTQSVLAGYTYGRDSLGEVLCDVTEPRRGFFA